MVVKDEVYQPRFEAYILHHGLNIGDEVKTWDFTAWIRRKWKEFDRLTGAKSPYSLDEHEHFTKWLLETVPENARQLELAL